MLNLKLKTDENPLNKSPLVSRKKFHVQLLSIRVFSADEHYELIVSLR